MKQVFSIQNSPRFNRGKRQKPSRTEAAAIVAGWAGMQFAWLKAQGIDASEISRFKLALQYRRRSRVPIMKQTQRKYFPQARRELEKLHGGAGNG